MEFTVKKTDLVKELRIGQGVVEKKTTIPVLSNVLVEAEEGELRLTSTDLELGLRTSCPATVAKSGVITIPSRKLLDYVNLLPDAELKIKVLDNNAISIVCGRSRTRMPGMSRENFPDQPEMPTPLTRIPAPLLMSAISKTAFAVANEESRYTLTGALVILRGDGFTMVATDGHRLAYFHQDVEIEGVSGELRALVPKKALNELQKLLNDGGDSAVVEFASDENHLFFRCGKRLLLTRKLTGQFPDYERVLPSNKSVDLMLNRDELVAALRRVSQFADDRSHAVRIELAEGELRLASSGSDAGESEETIPVEYDGGKLEIGFNSIYILDFLGVAATDTIEMQFQDDESAGQLQLPGQEGLDYRYVVMPMRI